MMGPGSSIVQDLQVLHRRLASTFCHVHNVATLPRIALEAVEDLELTMRNFALRWMDDLTPDARKDLGDAFDTYDDLKAQVERLAADVCRQRAEAQE